jgi:AraC-like DNA-binding protein
MVKKGHFDSAGDSLKRTSPGSLERVIYTPPVAYALDIEIISVDELRQRVMEHRFRQAHQINFYLMMLVENGRCQPVVDYTPLKCRKNSLILVCPNQALKFDLISTWEGWIAIFRPEFLAASVHDLGSDFFLGEEMQGLPTCTSLTEKSRLVVSSTFKLMREDTQDRNEQLLTNAMLRFQLKSLILRLVMLSNTKRGAETAAKQTTRFKRFRLLVEEKYAAHHKLSHYSSELGCTVKSLSRATLTASGIGAKEYLAARINLEAKRLLTHTQAPISAISEQLGFDEPTNFVKFFKRNCGLTPNEFRKQHYSIYN